MRFFLLLIKDVNGKDYMIIKLDIRKAYNRLGRDFIRKCFQELGSLIGGLISQCNVLLLHLSESL